MADLASHLNACRLKLATYKSGYNGKIILRSIHDDEVEWAMDSSDDPKLFVSGYIYDDVERADLLLGDLSIALVAAGYPHEITIDDEKNETTRKSSFMWSEHENS